MTGFESNNVPVRGPGRQEQVTVSCVLNNQSGTIQRFFVDVNFGASLPADFSNVSFTSSRMTTDFVADYAPAPNLSPKVTAHGEQAPGRSRMFGWIKDLLQGGPLVVKVTIGRSVVSTFLVAADADNSAVQKFLDNARTTKPPPDTCLKSWLPA